jgi:hypothetical protein
LHFPYTGGIPNNTGDFFPQALIPSHIRNSCGSATASAIPRVFTPHVPFILINKHLMCAHQPSTVPAHCPITSEPSSSSSATVSNKLHPHYTSGIPNNTGGFFPRALVPSRIRNSHGLATTSAVPRVFTPHMPFILINKHLTCTHQPSTGSPHVGQSHLNPRHHCV